MGKKNKVMTDIVAIDVITASGGIDPVELENKIYKQKAEPSWDQLKLATHFSGAG